MNETVRELAKATALGAYVLVVVGGVALVSVVVIGPVLRPIFAALYHGAVELSEISMEQALTLAAGVLGFAVVSALVGTLLRRLTDFGGTSDQ